MTRPDGEVTVSSAFLSGTFGNTKGQPRAGNIKSDIPAAADVDHSAIRDRRCYAVSIPLAMTFFYVNMCTIWNTGTGIAGNTTR